MRIVSLDPAATETLCLVGGSESLVGRTHACGFPETVQDRPVLTAQTAQSTDSGAMEPLCDGAWSLDIGLLGSLAPDALLLGRPGRFSAATREKIFAELGQRVRAIELAPETVEDVFESALTIGRVLGRESEATSAVVDLRERFYRACEFVTPFEEGARVAVLTGLEPLEVGGWWIPQLVERAGGSHPLNPTVAKEDAGAAAGFAHSERRAGAGRVITVDELLASRAEALVVCVPGVAISDVRVIVERIAEQPWWGSIPAVRSGRVALVDGRRGLALPGPGLVEAFAWLVGWLNGRPEVMPAGFGFAPM